MPIAVQFKERPATQEIFQANVFEGCGAHLPAIMGLASMKEKDAAIILRDDNEQLIFPGPGGYKITWSSGTKMVPLDVIICDKFEGLQAPTPDTTTTFVTDHNQDQVPEPQARWKQHMMNETQENRGDVDPETAVPRGNVTQH